MRPSAKTTSALSKQSQVSPYLRPRIPIPPPSARPVIPTAGPQPAGTVTPCSYSASYSSPSRAPAPTAAIRSLTSTQLIGVTSIIIPSVAERPATEWPPHRIDTGSRASRERPPHPRPGGSAYPSPRPRTSPRHPMQGRSAGRGGRPGHVAQCTMTLEQYVLSGPNGPPHLGCCGNWFTLPKSCAVVG